VGADTVRRVLLAGILSGLLGGCVVAEAPVVTAPPVAQVEVAPVAPGPGYVWVAGHWAWRRRGYVWRPGHWVVPAAPGYVWAPGHWAPRGGGFVWIEGRWRAR
jgi:WXXGXW repeat (2 copies)